ncbi:suppressor of fused domain protein [Dyella sp.]|uniref:suppressor of fused domain protein n=1 Tax=Dyella sp. TaxID=1869338 RepID=UPI002ED4ABF0
MGWFDRFRKHNQATPPNEPARSGQPADDVTHQRLDAYWASVGTPERDVLANLISPQLTGGVAWPTLRQAYRVVRRDHAIVLATDGMSDPFESLQPPLNGFGMELFLETSDIDPAFAGRRGDVSRLKDSWAFQLLHHVGELVAGAGGIVDRLETYGVLSMELPGVSQAPDIAVQVPGHFISEDDCLGILLGGPRPDFPDVIQDMPLSPVRMVPIVLITAKELAYVREGGAKARLQLADTLEVMPSRHRCDFQRRDATP